MAEEAALLPGTLDLLILKAVSLAPEHGYGVLLRIEQISGGALLVEQGALYPALFRLEHRGLIDGEWGVSENNRKARFYRLTAAGRRALKDQTESWSRLSAAMGAALAARPGEIEGHVGAAPVLDGRRDPARRRGARDGRGDRIPPADARRPLGGPGPAARRGAAPRAARVRRGGRLQGRLPAGAGPALPG